MSIMTFKGKLSFSDSKRSEHTAFNCDLGLYGNFRTLNPRTEAVYFSSLLDESVADTNAMIFTNYGFGIYRWEPCKVLGYSYRVSKSESNLKQEKKPRKCYVALHKGQLAEVRDFQIQMDPDLEASLTEYREKAKKSNRK